MKAAYLYWQKHNFYHNAGRTQVDLCQSRQAIKGNTTKSIYILISYFLKVAVNTNC
jgi:hypothetical protein